MFRVVLLLFLLVALATCSRKTDDIAIHYETKYVVIVVIDGPRYSETWGDPTRANIPVRDSLLSEGVLVTNFRNNGPTYTNPGHSAVCTGNYENIANDGSQLPTNPSFMQIWSKYTHKSPSKCEIIASKDKLKVLANCTNPMFQNQYVSTIDCGLNGDGTGGYRSDSVTQAHILNALSTQFPSLMVINFKDPDYYGHASDSANYIQAIRNTDRYVGEIWEAIQNNPYYKNKTTLIVTNDHGRHLDGVANGFTSHGDNCEGCRHIEFFALSPDFRKNVEISTDYEQIDISATIARLLHFPFYYGKGRVMEDIFL